MLALLVLLPSFLLAGEPDGAVAPAARWPGPRGPASGSFASHALPIVSDIEEAWKLEFVRVHTPPVHWDGRGYVVAKYKGKDALVAFDLRMGKVIAHKSLPGVPREIFVWDHTVYCQVIEGQITAYKLRGKTIVTPWKFRGRRGEGQNRLPHHPVVHDNEVYCLSGNRVVRLRPPSQWPVWAQRAPWTAMGQPAVYGRTAFVIGRGPKDIALQQFDRVDGVATVNHVAHTVPGFQGVDPQVTVTPGMIYVRTPWPVPTKVGKGNYALIPCEWRESGLARFKGPVYVANLAVPPAYTRLGSLCLGIKPGGREWQLRLPTGHYHILATEKEQPYLFKDLVAPTILGDIAYCGSWAVDLATRELLWKLPVQRVSFPVVPADRMILIVEERRALRAFRGRGKK